LFSPRSLPPPVWPAAFPTPFCFCHPPWQLSFFAVQLLCLRVFWSLLYQPFVGMSLFGTATGLPLHYMSYVVLPLLFYHRIHPIMAAAASSRHLHLLLAVTSHLRNIRQPTSAVFTLLSLLDSLDTTLLYLVFSFHIVLSAECIGNCISLCFNYFSAEAC
jgi:hypothetical protein